MKDKNLKPNNYNNLCWVGNFVMWWKAHFSFKLDPMSHITSSSSKVLSRSVPFCPGDSVSGCHGIGFYFRYHHRGHWHMTEESATGSELPGPCFNIKTFFPGMLILMIKRRQSQDHFTFIIGIPILRKTVFLFKWAPGYFWTQVLELM